MIEIKPNDFTLLVSKFKNESGLITATDVNKKYIARTETSQYRRDLLHMAVVKGLAWSNGKHQNHNKYGIYFNAENRVNVVIERTFDPSVLSHPNIINLPPRRMKIGKNAKEIGKWNREKEHWIDIYQLLCGFQHEGEINLKLLPDWYCTDLKQIESIEAREIIIVYKIIKLGWDELKQYCPYYEISGYNDLFHEWLWAGSVCRFSNFGVNFFDKPRAQIDYLRELHDSQMGVNDSDYQKVVGKFFGSNLDKYQQESKDPLVRFAYGMSIKNALSKTESTDLKKLFAEWEKLNHECRLMNNKILSRKIDKPRHKKFEEKLLAQCLKTFESQS